jgi:hypothetical protein
MTQAQTNIPTLEELLNMDSDEYLKRYPTPDAAWQEQLGLINNQASSYDCLPRRDLLNKIIELEAQVKDREDQMAYKDECFAFYRLVAKEVSEEFAEQVEARTEDILSGERQNIGSGKFPSSEAGLPAEQAGANEQVRTSPSEEGSLFVSSSLEPYKTRNPEEPILKVRDESGELRAQVYDEEIEYLKKDEYCE